MEDGLTSSDVLSLTRNNGTFGGDGGGLWLFALLMLGMMSGGFGWGNRGNDGGYQPQYATQADVQSQAMYGQLIDGNRDIVSQANANSSNLLNAINSAEYENIAVVKDAQLQLQDRLSAIAVTQADAIANQNQCCSNTRLELANQSAGINMGIMQNRYESAMNTAAINTNTTAQTQKILDAISANRIADMQNQINQLQLANQMANVIRFPNQWTYAGGFFPPLVPPLPTTTTGGTTTG